MLDFCWYIFIMLVVGQLGPLLAVGITFWNNKPVWPTVESQANNGNLLTFAVALLAGSSYFVVKEFHGDGGIKRARLKSPLLLLTIITGFAGALVCTGLTKEPSAAMTSWQAGWHWVLYCACIGLALVWWYIEEAQGSLNDLNWEVQTSANSMTAASSNASQTPSTKVTV